MYRPVHGTMCLVGAALLFGCAHSTATGRLANEPGPDSDAAHGTPNHAIVFTSEQLARRNTDLLSALTGHVAGMQVALTPGCPAITLRGANSMTMFSNPRIYVNGEPAANTCILQSLSTADLQRVEVYPSGISSRPGYFNDANGLILIFMKNSGTP